jgi:hypothetical protein
MMMMTAAAAMTPRRPDGAAPDGRGPRMPADPTRRASIPNRCPSRFDHAYRQARYFYLRGRRQ